MMMLYYDNDDEHKGSNADSEENLHCKHTVLQYDTRYMQCGHYYHCHNKIKGIIGDDMGII